MRDCVFNYEKEIDWKRLNAEVEKIVLGKLGNDAEDRLAIDGTKLEKLAQTCPDLTHLYLWNLDGLKELPELPAKLKCLDVRGCKELQTVSELPKTMETLDLGGCNTIQDLKDKDFSGFKSLTRVYLNGCTSLKSFVPFLAVAPQLKELTVEGCHFDGLPGALCRPGNMAGDVQTWLAEQDEERQGVTLINTVKVLLIGNGRVGKTTLARRLQGLAPNKEEPSTHAIHFWSLKWNDFRPKGSETDETLTLNLWDFGGQDLYHNTHRIFFQGASIFLVVWSVSPPALKEGELEENQPRSLSYWLDQVLSVNPQATVVLVRGRADFDKGKATWQDHVEERHRSLVNVIDAGEFNGLEKSGAARFDGQLRKVREAIQLAAASVLGSVETRRHPTGWSRVAERLVDIQRRNTDAETNKQKMQDTVWDRATFMELVKQVCVNRDGSQAGDTQDPEPLLRWLHAAGYLFYDKEHFGEKLIVDQRWAVKGIYTLFWRKDGKETLLLLNLRSGGGKTTRAALSEYGWTPQGFDPAEQEVFFLFMTSCGLLVELESGWVRADHETLYLVPQHLPTLRDENVARHRNHYKPRTGEKSDALIIKHNQLGISIVQYFIFEVLREFGKAADAWKWGVGFELGDGSARADIEWTEISQDTYGGSLAIHVGGTKKGVLKVASAIRDVLENAPGIPKQIDWGSFGKIEEFPSDPRSRQEWDEAEFGTRHKPGVSLGRSAPLNGYSQNEQGRAVHPVTVGISLAGSSALNAKKKTLESLADKPTLLEKINQVADLETLPRLLCRALSERGTHVRFKVEIYLDQDSHGEHHTAAIRDELTHSDFGIVFLSGKYLFSRGCMPELVEMFTHSTEGFPVGSYQLFRFPTANLTGPEWQAWEEYWQQLARAKSLEAKRLIKEEGLEFFEAWNRTDDDQGLFSFYKHIAAGVLARIRYQLRNYARYRVGKSDECPSEPDDVASWLVNVCEQVEKRLNSIEDRKSEASKIHFELMKAYSKRDANLVCELYLKWRALAPNFESEEKDMLRLQKEKHLDPGIEAIRGYFLETRDLEDLS